MANITCRVADTGRLLGMEVSLQNLNQPSHAQNYLTGYTNLEGRVNYWAFMGKDKQFIASREDQISVWRLKFYIGKYYGLPKGIHQKVVTDIRVERYDNCCIVLEAGHYGYKTYREVSSETQELSEVLQRDVFFKWHDLMHETSHFSEAQLQILRLYLANEGPRAQHFSDVIANQLNVDKNEVFVCIYPRNAGLS
jgi:5-hydroxyisourate hydrolase-like protein (transthyretin family)